MRSFISLTTVLAWCCGTLLTTGSFAAGDGVQPHAHGHDHGTAAHVTPPSDGRKWATDEPLRQSMAGIRNDFAAALHDIHAGKLSADGYVALSRKVRTEVDAMIRNCKLDPQADAQLHGIIGALLEGAEAMEIKDGKEGKSKGAKRTKPRAGAEKVLKALDDYGRRFDDPGWQPIEHATH